MFVETTAGKLRLSKLWTYVVVYLLFLYMPILLLPIFSFNDGTIIAFPLKGFTFKWYEQLLHADGLFDSLKSTLWVAGATAVISTFMGLLAASAMARYPFKGDKLAYGIIMTPLLIPGMIIATGMLILLVQLGLKPSLFTVMLGHVFLTIPFSVSILKASFDQFDNSLEEAAIDLGESFWGALWRVVLPVVMPGIVSSMLVTFTVSFDEFILAFFLSGSEPTLPVYIWSQVRFPGKLPSILALGTILIFVSIALLMLSEWVKRRGELSDKRGINS